MEIDHSGPCIPVFILGEGHTPIPPLSRKEAISLAEVILQQEARRSVQRGQHSDEPIRGDFICYSSRSTWRRGSDRVERVYAAVELLQRSGLTNKEASLEVAAMLGQRIGNSGRGRKRRRPLDELHRAETVRALYNDFKNRHPFKEKLPTHDPIVEKWYSLVLSFSAWAMEVVNAKEKLLEDYQSSRNLFQWRKGCTVGKIPAPTMPDSAVPL